MNTQLPTQTICNDEVRVNFDYSSTQYPDLQIIKEGRPASLVISIDKETKQLSIDGIVLDGIQSYALKNFISKNL